MQNYKNMQPNWKSSSELINVDNNTPQDPNNSSQNYYSPEIIEIISLKKKFEGIEKILTQVSLRNLPFLININSLMKG